MQDAGLLDVQRVPISQLKPAAYNPRKPLKPGDPAYEKLKRSIATFGCVDSLVWNKRTGNLVGGHQRLSILVNECRAEMVDVSVVDLDDAHEKALNIALNKITGEWDDEALSKLLLEIQQDKTVDEVLSGFDYAEIDAQLDKTGDLVVEPLGDPNDVPEPPAEPVSKRGDLYILGKHRLLCGDSTSAEDVRRLMDGQRAALFATDPPYLVDYDGTNHPHKWGEKDKNKDWTETYGVTWDEAAANPELYDKFIGMAVAEAILPDAAWYCWHASRRQAMLEAIWEKHGAFVHQQIIWAKDRPILTRSWYMWQHEPCFFGWVRPNKPARVADDHPHSVWNIATVPAGEKTDHPTSKPVEVFEIPMRQHTKVGDVCYEPFSGSGSQIIAAEQTSRRCFAMEISPAYVDVAVKRWEKFTGKKAELIR